MLVIVCTEDVIIYFSLFSGRDFIIFLHSDTFIKENVDSFFDCIGFHFGRVLEHEVGPLFVQEEFGEVPRDFFSSEGS